MKDVVDLAQRAGLVFESGGRLFIGDGSGRFGCQQELQAFAVAIAEECAKLCDGEALEADAAGEDEAGFACARLADAMRAMYKKP